MSKNLKIGYSTRKCHFCGKRGTDRRPVKSMVDVETFKSIPVCRPCEKKYKWR